MALFDTVSMTSRDIGEMFPDRTMYVLQVSFPRLKSMVEIFKLEQDIQTLHLANDL
jgi:aromatic ring-opening dioxygenase catalytic subunit (LigB family)